MNKNGIVEKVEASRVTVKITRDSSCGENCAMCNACPGKNMLLTLDTEIPFEIGDRVRLETNTAYVLLSAFCVYILPIILLIVGYGTLGIWAGLCLMVLSFVLLYLADKKINTKMLIKIKKLD